MMIAPAAFVPYRDTYDWRISHNFLGSFSSLDNQGYYAGLNFPQGVTLTKMTLYGNRKDALALMNLKLYRSQPGVSLDEMAEVVADWITGAGSGYDDSINYATINNETGAYILFLSLTPNDAADDVSLQGVKIEFS